MESLTADLNLNVIKDIRDHSCYLARLDEYWHFMTAPPRGPGGIEAEVFYSTRGGEWGFKLCWVNQVLFTKYTTQHAILRD